MCKMLYKIDKTLSYSHITPRPLGEPSVSPRRSDHSLFSIELLTPEKIYTITQKEYIFMHERYTLFFSLSYHHHFSGGIIADFYQICATCRSVEVQRSVFILLGYQRPSSHII